MWNLNLICLIQANSLNRPSSSVQECARRTCSPGRPADSRSWWWSRRWPAWDPSRCSGPEWWPAASDQSPDAGRYSWAGKVPSSWGALSPVCISINQMQNKFFKEQCGKLDLLVGTGGTAATKFLSQHLNSCLAANHHFEQSSVNAPTEHLALQKTTIRKHEFWILPELWKAITNIAASGKDRGASSKKWKVMI